MEQIEQIITENRTEAKQDFISWFGMRIEHPSDDMKNRLLAYKAAANQAWRFIEAHCTFYDESKGKKRCTFNRGVFDTWMGIAKTKQDESE